MQAGTYHHHQPAFTFLVKAKSFNLGLAWLTTKPSVLKQFYLKESIKLNIQNKKGQANSMKSKPPNQNSHFLFKYYISKLRWKGVLSLCLQWGLILSLYLLVDYQRPSATSTACANNLDCVPVFFCPYPYWKYQYLQSGLAIAGTQEPPSI